MAQLIAGITGDWEIVIGLEVHAQVSSEAKLFSGAATSFGAAPNSQVSLVDAAMPGMLPVINQECVRQAVKTGLGINAEINLFSVFDRKNYFYPDLPQGYQISQYKQPVVGEGTLAISVSDGEKVIGIERLHLEQDAGKSLHDQHPSKTYIDLNRSGVALMEIVSKPDLRSSEEAAAYVKKLRAIMRYLGTCDGNMQEGSLRCDVNVSVRKLGDALGTRCEIKNVNSIRFVQQAIEYEARRQIEIIEDGGTIDQETRLFDANRGETRSMRSKEDAHDYRYFPDPDLLPLEFTQDYVDAIAAELPELPDAKIERYLSEEGLSPDDAAWFAEGPENSEYLENVSEGRDTKKAASWIINDVVGANNSIGVTMSNTPITPKNSGEIIDLIDDGTLSLRIVREKVLPELIKNPATDVKIFVNDEGLRQVSDAGAIEALIDEVLAGNADKVAEYKAGKDKLLGFFVGQVMKKSQGKANPQMVNSVLREKLGG
jgi:aspartyl-tRNA(Asn)/glutamyl-tRNA(Gln) amidotransferase subunit B